MATLESALTVFAAYSFSTKCRLSAKPPDSIAIKLHASTSLFSLPNNLVFSFKPSSSIKPCFELCSALQEAAREEKPIKPPRQQTPRRSFTCLIYQCGTVTDVEIIRTKDGRNRGFAFVSVAFGEEAQVAIDKFDSHEISGRIIRVELAKRFKKPPQPRPPGAPTGQTRHIIYASNLAWKLRSTHLGEFFTENFKIPASARVVFDSPSGRSAGYGFVSYVKREEAEAAISSLDGKELMGRQLLLKFSQKNVEEAGSEKDEGQGYDAQLEES